MEAVQRTKVDAIDRLRPNKQGSRKGLFLKSTVQPYSSSNANGLCTVGGSPPWSHKAAPVKRAFKRSFLIKKRKSKHARFFAKRQAFMDQAILDLCRIEVANEPEKMKDKRKHGVLKNGNLGRKVLIQPGAFKLQLKGVMPAYIFFPEPPKKGVRLTQKDVELSIAHLYATLTPAKAKAVERRLVRSASFMNLYEGQAALKEVYGTTTAADHRAKLTEQQQAIMGKASERLKEKLGFDLIAALEKDRKATAAKAAINRSF